MKTALVAASELLIALQLCECGHEYQDHRRWTSPSGASVHDVCADMSCPCVQFVATTSIKTAELVREVRLLYRALETAAERHWADHFDRLHEPDLAPVIEIARAA